MLTCPQCGYDAPNDQFQEGYCIHCYTDNQRALDEHNAQYDYWSSLLQQQRSGIIKEHTMDMTGLTPVKRLHPGDKQYYCYKCVSCGDDAHNGYMGKQNEPMLENRECYSCNYWRNFEKNKNLAEMTIIDGRVYGPGNRTSGSFRGMAGRRFDIEYIAPSRYAGKRITTFDLWADGQIPDRLREKFPDTARFLNGAHEAHLSGPTTTAWDPSNSKNEPYPLPKSIGIR